VVSDLSFPNKQSENMARSDLLPGVQVRICIDGKPAEEIDTINDKVRYRNKQIGMHWNRVTSTKYIESCTGKEFTIELQTSELFKNAPHYLEYAIEVDGNEIRGGFLESKDIVNGQWSCTFDGPTTDTPDGMAVMPMKFAEIKTSKKISRRFGRTCNRGWHSPASEVAEKSILKQQAEELDDVGSIHVLIYEVAIGRQQAPESGKFGSIGGVSNLNEKVLAADLKSRGTMHGHLSIHTKVFANRRSQQIRKS
jgi:hypothetical protein